MSDKVFKVIKSNINAILQTDHFSDWLSKEKVEKDDLIFFNNSFIFRQNFKTNKSDKVLGIQVDKNGKTTSSEIYVTNELNFNTDFKRISHKSSNIPKIEELNVVIKKEMKVLGKLIFLLIGEIENEDIELEVAFPDFKKLVFRHTQKELLTIERSQLYINTVDDEEMLWEEIKKCNEIKKLKIEEISQYEENFIKVLSKMRETANLKINLDKCSKTSESLLGKFSKSLSSQSDEYKKHLKKFVSSDDQSSLHDLLRIAYNFSSDALTLLELLIGISDLKPIVSWLTLSSHYELAHAFREIPWKKSSGKGSFALYKEMIGGARNHAFHNLFSLPCAVEVNMKGVQLNARQLRLFSSHNKKGENVLKYEDDELVEILSRFTRAPERNMSIDFFRRNKDVIEKTVKFVEEKANALKILAVK